MGRNMLARGFLAAAMAVIATGSVHAQVVRDDEPTISKGLVTPVRKWQDASKQARAVVLLLHGFPEHSLLYDKLATTMAEDGFIVYAPDMRGLGRAYASGSAERIDYVRRGDYDVARLAERIRKEHKGLKLLVGGESMGGALAIRLAAERPELADGVILSGPAVKLQHHYARLIPRSLLNIVTLGTVKVDFTKQMEQFFSSDPKIAKELVLDPLVRKKFNTRELLEAKKFPRETEQYVSQIPAKTPVLVLQACDDKQTNPNSLYLFDAKLKSTDITYVIYSYGGHTILQTSHIDPFSTKTVMDWLNKQVPANKKP
ncbi:MAG: lysophospholipase [Candidatus Obscuribacterales bacterium]|nr:lysophospholipase [Candidatus Obscuribacterales bacterium]